MCLCQTLNIKSMYTVAFIYFDLHKKGPSSTEIFLKGIVTKKSSPAVHNLNSTQYSKSTKNPFENFRESQIFSTKLWIFN